MIAIESKRKQNWSRQKKKKTKLVKKKQKKLQFAKLGN